MSKNNAIKYLKFLHSLEMQYRDSLVTYELASLLEEVRLKFLIEYQLGKEVRL